MALGKWRKSTRSVNSGGNCVEARKSVSFEVRDSKLGDASPVLAMSMSDFKGLLSTLE